MPRFSKRSEDRLASCHPDLQLLFRIVIRHWDCAVLCGHRGRVKQDQLFAAGYSHVQYPDSKHNSVPSNAIDVAPYPIDWTDFERFRAFGGFVLGVAACNGIKIRWGGDWDGDRSFKDQRFVDLPHFELIS